MQKLWKSIKKCKTYSIKATGLFFSDTVYKSAEGLIAVCSVCLEKIGKVLSDYKEKISQLVCVFFISYQTGDV